MISDLCRSDLPVLLIYNFDLSWSQQEIQDWLESLHCMADALIEVGHPLQEVSVYSAQLESILGSFCPDECLVFNRCEELPGIPHSEHRVTQVLDRMGFTYTGAGSPALALNQDKCLVKRQLQRWGILTPAWRVYTTTPVELWKRFPAIVKPAFEHCSYGITRESVVQSTMELVQRVEYVLDELHQPAIVEDFIDGPEFHVGLIGNGALRVLPPAEIDYTPFDDIHDRLCTYESNVDKSSLAYRVTFPKLPVTMPESQLHQLEEVVVAAYRAIDCRDYARMDVRLRDGVFYVLDVNPNADLGPDTSLVMAAELIGLSYGQLGSLLVNLAAQRHPVFGSAYCQHSE